MPNKLVRRFMPAKKCQKRRIYRENQKKKTEGEEKEEEIMVRVERTEEERGGDGQI